MPSIPFGKRQGFTDVSPGTLPERVVPPFDMRRLAGVLADAPMRFDRKNGGVGVPDIADTDARPVARGNALPETVTRAFATVADHEGEDLARPPTQDGPEPAFPRPFSDERPHFVEFQTIIGLNGLEGRAERQQGQDFF